MLVWAIYDISGNSKRNRIIILCKGYGLHRVQKSVFFGDMNSNQIDELALQSKQVINEETDSVYIFPMCEEDFKKVRLIGKSFDKDFVTDRIRELFV